MKKEIVSIPLEGIISKILLIRGKKVILDQDLASLYEVSTRDLNKAVRRNLSRFPEDFMFELSPEEFKRLMFQFGTSKKGHGGRRKLPLAFTEQGVAMLSSVLKSEKAIQMNVQIIRTFTKLREILLENKDLAEKIQKMELKYDKQISHIFEVLKRLLVEEVKPKRKFGFSMSKS
jgi:hypothetical protein